MEKLQFHVLRFERLVLACGQNADVEQQQQQREKDDLVPLSAAGQRSSVFLRLHADPGPDLLLKSSIYDASVTLCSVGHKTFCRRVLSKFQPEASIKY